MIRELGFDHVFAVTRSRTFADRRRRDSWTCLKRADPKRLRDVTIVAYLTVV